MKTVQRWLPVIPALVLAFFLSCTWDSDKKYVDYKLHGTWESTMTDYSGRLLIGYDTIMIIGYDPSQTLQDGDDTKRPFRDFAKNIPLECYTEEGKLFIQKTAGMKSVPYHYSSAGQKSLLFNFGNPPNDREEALEKIER